MEYETIWLKDSHILASRRFRTRAEAERDAQQLLPYYQKHFAATRAEVWHEKRRLLMIDGSDDARWGADSP